MMNLTTYFEIIARKLKSVHLYKMTLWSMNNFNSSTYLPWCCQIFGIKSLFWKVLRLRPFVLLLNGSFKNNGDDDYGTLVERYWRQTRNIGWLIRTQCPVVHHKTHKDWPEHKSWLQCCLKYKFHLELYLRIRSLLHSKHITSALQRPTG